MNESYLKRQELFLEQILTTTNIPATEIRKAIHYSLFPGGKRMRPILVYLTGKLLGIQLLVLDLIAAAIELTHCYSLIHDDLPAMDDDDMRRGKPSCHKAFNEATAILAGDGLQALAIEVLLTRLPAYLTATQIIKITQELITASGVSGMVSGQSLDLSELSKNTLTQEKLIEIHHLKTGKLISASVEMVLAASDNVYAEQSAALRDYAAHLGLVFQIQDDYLDFYAPANFLGKGRSSDTANDKTTFATLMDKQTLEQEISRHYQIANQALELFGDNAQELIQLTQQLEARSKL